jgi:iron complex outermembrane receptor protein
VRPARHRHQPRRGGGLLGPAAAGQAVVPGSVTGGPIFANAFPGNNPSTQDPRTFIQETTSTNKQRADLALAGNLTYHAPGFDVTYLGGYQKFNYQLNFTNGADSGITSYALQGAPSVGPVCGFYATATGADPSLCTAPLTVFPSPSTTYFAEVDKFYSHEIDLTSTNDSPLQWIAGAYYYHEKYDQPVWAGTQPAQTQLAHPVFTNLTPAPANPSSAISTSDTQLTYNSWAVFGHVDYKFSDAWKAHIGVRYTSDHKYGEQFWRFLEFGVLNVPGVIDFRPSSFGALTQAIDVTASATAASLGETFPGAGPASIDTTTGFAHRDLDAKWNEWTGDIGLDWTPDENTLVYGKYSRGYKAGGFSTFTLAANPETDKETVDAFEAGLKKTFAGQFRLNAAAFWYNYKNDQIPLSVQNAEGLIASQLFNLKSVHIYGVELEGLWQVTDDLVVNAEYSHLTAKVNDPGGCFEDTIDPTASLPGANVSGCVQPATGIIRVQNLKDNQLPGSPPNKFTANVIYTWQFDPGKLSLSATFIWKDQTYGTLFNRPYSLAPAFYQTNLRAVWTGANNRYNVIAYVDNVFDEANVDGRTGTLLVAPTAAGQVGQIVTNNFLVNPRVYGVEFRYRFQ